MMQNLRALQHLFHKFLIPSPYTLRFVTAPVALIADMGLGQDLISSLFKI